MGQKILVTGGTGFIGSEICRIATEAGHHVVSVSNKPAPRNGGDWVDRITWIEADILDALSWRHHLEDCNAVIHCVDLTREHPQDGHTFERVNDDAAEIVAWEAEHAGVEHFVLVSSETKPLFVSDRYLEAKRRAESAIRGHNYRESILRPAYVYGPGRPATAAFAQILKSSSRLPGLGSLGNGHRPLHVDQVAMAAVRAATEPGYEGTIGVDLIEYLAEDRWKTFAESQSAPRPRVNPMLVAGIAAGLTAGLIWGILRNRD